MIHLVICKWRVSELWLKQLAEEHNAQFPDDVREYPESWATRTQQVEWCQSFADGLQGDVTVITDGDHVINEFRCMVKEGNLNELKMTEVCSEGNGYFLVDYHIDSDGRYDTRSELLGLYGSHMARLM